MLCLYIYVYAHTAEYAATQIGTVYVCGHEYVHECVYVYVYVYICIYANAQNEAMQVRMLVYMYA